MYLYLRYEIMILKYFSKQIKIKQILTHGRYTWYIVWNFNQIFQYNNLQTYCYWEEAALDPTINSDVYLLDWKQCILQWSFLFKTTK